MAFDKIIVLDDEVVIRKSLEEQLRSKRYSVASVGTLAEAESLLNKDQFDLIFVDVRLPDGEGTQLLERLAEQRNSPLIVMMTGYGTIESAVHCMKLGAFDYIIKPFSMEEIGILLKKAESYQQILKVNQYFSSHEQSEHSEILGDSAPIKNLNQLIKKVATTEATVLVTGENGTGKELVAHELHKLSQRANKPFIKVNCAAISETLIESEFFGHEKGAFTGATQRREGRFELAHNGTILLDEIGEISPSLQAKLLRVLQEQEFERVGGNKTLKTNVRVIASTNRNLLQAVERGEFREDLYYRLNVFPIAVPSLKDRGNDCLLLANAFLQKLSRKHGKSIPGFSSEAQQAITCHNWPGNVRELQNTVERAIILTDPETSIKPYSLGIIPSDLLKTPSESEPSEQHSKIDSMSLYSEDKSQKITTQSLEDLEKEHILKVLEDSNDNKTKAAEILKITPRTLRNKLKQYSTKAE